MTMRANTNRMCDAATRSKPLPSVIYRGNLSGGASDILIATYPNL